MGLSECEHPLDGLHPSHQRQRGATASLGHSNEPPREKHGHWKRMNMLTRSLVNR